MSESLSCFSKIMNRYKATVITVTAKTIFIGASQSGVSTSLSINGHYLVSSDLMSIEVLVTHIERQWKCKVKSNLNSILFITAYISFKLFHYTGQNVLYLCN